MKVIEDLIQQAGGMEAMQEDYLRLENPPYMPLVVEVVTGWLPGGWYEVSVAHYGEMNGDLMADPEMTFLVRPCTGGAWQWVPLTFTNHYMGTYHVAATYDHPAGTYREENPRLARELAAFAALWNRNLSEQGYLAAWGHTARGQTAALRQTTAQVAAGHGGGQ